MTVRKKVSSKPKVKLSSPPGIKATSKPGPKVSILRLTANRVATTTIRVSEDGVVEITDAVLSELVKRLAAEGKKQLVYKVISPTMGMGKTPKMASKAGVNDPPPPPETNCEPPPPPP